MEARSSTIRLYLEETGDRLTVRLEDNGVGMDAETVRRAQDPFYTDGVKHPGRAVGLGIPFLRQLADATGGRFSLESAPGVGTTVELVVPREHLDLPPTGDLPTVLQQALCYAGDYEMVIQRRRDTAGYQVSRRELVEVLGDLETVGSQALLREYIAAQEESLDDTEAETWQR